MDPHTILLQAIKLAERASELGVAVVTALKAFHDQLYPAAHDKFGHADVLGWRNVRNIKINSVYELTRSLVLTAMYNDSWLAEATDAAYNAQGRAIARGALAGRVARAVQQGVRGRAAGRRELDRLGRRTPLRADAEIPWWKGAGCDHCGGTGLKGRQGLYEVMAMTGPLRKQVLKSTDAGALRDLAISEGMLTLRMDGWLKVLKGVTTLEQVIRETSA